MASICRYRSKSTCFSSVAGRSSRLRFTGFVSSGAEYSGSPPRALPVTPSLIWARSGAPEREQRQLAGRAQSHGRAGGAGAAAHVERRCLEAIEAGREPRHEAREVEASLEAGNGEL